MLVEGGGETHAAFVDAGLVDRVALFLAPLLLGGREATGVIGGAGRDLKAALRLAPLTVTDRRRRPADRGRRPRRAGAALMFTGIVEELGTVRAVERRGDVARLEVAARVAREGSDLGASVAVNGVCLTVVATAPDALAFEVGPETLARTTLGRLGPRGRGEPRATAALRRRARRATSSWATSTASEPWGP